ncbi:ATP-binding cassette domain-containing protein [Bifidobacterium panos]|uniref:ABC transporter ATP-binding protein n=1 Tax=Bifidobacterium panos TaxID=2675321 RepID=A0ABX1SYT1_9BIFI|nr:ATP-binding cassette domain-containing protein [Bifidobacterium sp. DSM 109963]NMN01568.1 ABC transporter ATP-binding protein [Bifidobacterium sp. DSM 109963]
MVDKRLFRLAPGLGRLVAGKVVCLWIGLLANIGFMTTLVTLIGGMLFVGGPEVSRADRALYVCVLVVCMMIRYVVTVMATRLGTEASGRVKLVLRVKLYRKMLALGPSYAVRVNTSDVVQSAGEGIEQIQSFFELFLPQLLYAVLAPLTLFAVIAPLNIPTALTLLACAPLIVLIVGLVAMNAARAFKRYWGRYTDMGAAFLDNLQGLETLKAFDADDRAAVEMDEKAENFRVMTMRVLQIQLRSLSAMDVVAYGGTAAGIGVALWQYIHPGVSSVPLDLSGMLLIVLLSADFFIPLRQLGSYFHMAMNGMTSTKRIFALLDAPEPERGARELPASVKSQRVVFDRVSFSYPDIEQPALQDVSFTANPGELTAIVGVSGSGKSTAAALLTGMRAGYGGSLTIGGVELSTLSGDALSHAVTLVGARSHLFAGTVRENLLMANPQASDDALWDALDRARIADFVRSQEAGLDFIIEPDAANLSGGQRQRIAVARALLHDSAIYVFDEATSSVDVDSESLILEAIHDLAQVRGKTVIMITHRMANAEHAARIVVFANGRSAETGRHAELMAAHGAYARLYTAQRDIETIAPVQQTVSHVSQTSQMSRTSRTGHGKPQKAAVRAAKRTPPSRRRLRRHQAHRSTSTPYALIGRLLAQARPLSRLMIAACVAGSLGHLAATFLSVFGIVALFALVGVPVWSMGAPLAVALMVLCAVTRGAMRYIEQYLNHNVAFRLLALLRSKAFAALRRLAPAKLAGHGKGELIATLTTDVELLEIFFAHTISPVVIAVTTTLVCAIALATLNPWMALLLIASHLVIGVIVPKCFAMGVRHLGPAIRSQASDLDDIMLDDMRGLGEIIGLGCGRERVVRISRDSRRLQMSHDKLSRVNGRFSAIGGVLVLLLTVLAARLCMHLAAIVAFDATPVAALTTAFVLFASSFGPTLALAALPASLTQTFAAARRLFALMDEAPAVVERGKATPEYQGMRCDDVTFSYPNTASGPVLAGFSLDVPSQGVLGVQGASGRGKSTMLKLLMRYWDPQSGTVSLSGTPLPDVDAHRRRRVQAVMSQETHLFDGTIRDNLLLALPPHVAFALGPKTLDARMRQACRKASVLDFIDSLPSGFDTPVGELGDRLSEGERQRIGLARVFLRNADLILFDEPTSRLDTLNEAIILKSIAALARGGETAAQADGASSQGAKPATKAVILVSHRESAMRIAGTMMKW